MSEPRDPAPAPAPDPLAGRLMELEIRYTHLVDVVDQLSDLVRVQQDTLDELRSAVERLGRRVGPGDNPSEAQLDPEHHKPPHY